MCFLTWKGDHAQNSVVKYDLIYGPIEKCYRL